MARLLAAAGDGDAAAVPPASSSPVRRTRPEASDVVQVRHRQYLVEEVIPPGGPDEASRVVLSGLDDDNQGRRLEALWEIELGARILQPELHGPDTRGQLDPPRAFDTEDAGFAHSEAGGCGSRASCRLRAARLAGGQGAQGRQAPPRSLDSNRVSW